MLGWLISHLTMTDLVEIYLVLSQPSHLKQDFSGITIERLGTYP